MQADWKSWASPSSLWRWGRARGVRIALAPLAEAMPCLAPRACHGSTEGLRVIQNWAWNFLLPWLEKKPLSSCALRSLQSGAEKAPRRPALDAQCCFTRIQPLLGRGRAGGTARTLHPSAQGWRGNEDRGPVPLGAARIMGPTLLPSTWEMEFSTCMLHFTHGMLDTACNTLQMVCCLPHVNSMSHTAWVTLHGTLHT